jgi:hypothetical protein
MKHLRKASVRRFLYASALLLAAVGFVVGRGGMLRTPTGLAAPGQEEFSGPFASWADAKTGYGAKGDGVADDTSALQAALDDLGNANKPDVLYLPAGVYRITATLNLKYKTNISVIGEDPVRTTIHWSGQRKDAMMLVNGVTHSRWGRITWDGAGIASAGVAHQWDHNGGYAPTNLEHSGEVFENLGKGIIGGRWGGANDGEVTIIRSKFLNCSEAGVSVESFNALDYWIWDSEFVNNARGITNEFGAGNFMVYRSFFRYSRIADLSIANTQYFSFRGNTSIGSRQFFHAKNAGRNAASTTIQDNQIIDTINPVAVEVENVGPLILIDNQIRSTAGATGPAVRLSTASEGGDLVSVGNTFTVNDPVAVQAPSLRRWMQEDQVVPFAKIDATAPVMPGPLPNLHRRVIDVPVGSHSDAIQKAINQAAETLKDRPIVHLGKGEYWLDQTVLVPAKVDVQIVGDGRGTNLAWNGPAGVPMFELAGPSKAVIQDMYLNGNKNADGIAIRVADQPGSRVLAVGMYQEHTAQNNFLALGLENTAVDLQSHQMVKGKAASIKVAGAGGGGSSRVAIFGGTSGAEAAGSEPAYEVSNGGRIVVQDTWYEGPGSRLVYLKDSGSFTYSGGHIAPQASPPDPVVEVAGFNGTATFVGVDFDLDHSQKRIQVTRETANTKMLFLGLQANLPDYFSRLSSGGNLSFLQNKMYRDGAFPVRDAGDRPTPAFIHSMLSQMRSVKPSSSDSLPPHVTDVRLSRLGIASAIVGVSIQK